MDKDTLLKALAGTLDAGNYQVRQQSEQQLKVFGQQPGFMAYLLELSTEDNIPLGIQISATVLFKNRISNHWIADASKNSSLTIREDEKPIIKEKLIETLVKTNKNSKLRVQLAAALHSIVNTEKWEQLVTIIKRLLSSGDIDQINAGLICLYQYTRAYRWSSLEGANTSNPVLEEVATELFPTLENLTDGLINDGSTASGEMLYLIVKIFKFTTYSSLPSYIQNPQHLGKWCQNQILIINKPLPEAVMKETSLEERSLNPWVKTVKWCFGNLHRLLMRHGGGYSTKDKENNQFAKDFLENFVPEILKVYWSIIESWSSKKVWLSEGSLYHMISFLEQLVETPVWNLIFGELEAILKHVILPTLNATQETVELYEDDPEEYVRRFFDINRESNTSDVASISFIYRLASKKFKETSTLMLSIITDIFDRRTKNRADISIAMEAEGALRILTTISYKLNKKISPVHGQIDQLLHAYVYPELLPESSSKTPWLTARACDTIAMFIYQYKDQNVLHDIFQGIIACFQMEDHIPIQITAVDALRTLVDDDAVAQHISGQAPQLMGTLIDMSKKMESDTLTSVMESFVEKFAASLEPYANELSGRLAEEFLRLANELLDQATTTNSSTVDADKEYQALGIINTITTLVVAMSSSPAVAVTLEPILKNMIEFVLHNAQVAFLAEAVDIMDSIVVTIQHVSPIGWELFQCVVDVFDSYALDFFDNFDTYFETIIYYGFTNPQVTIENPQVQALLTICFNVLRSEQLDPIFAHHAFELIELIIIALKERFEPFLLRFLPEIFGIFTNLEAQDAFDGYMLHHLSILRIFFATAYVNPTTTLRFLQEKNFMATFCKLWVQYSEDFQSVYGCKLQILACLSILCDGDLSVIQDKDILSEFKDLLVSNLEMLPHAIKARQDIENKELGIRQIGNEDDDEEGVELTADYLDELEADEAELEAMKQTPIDSVNVYEVFVKKLTHLQQHDTARYQDIVGQFDDEQRATVSHVFETFNKINQQAASQ